MNRFPRTAAATTVLAPAVLVGSLLVAAPAHAATSTFRDAAGDIGPGVDLRRVKVTNGEQNLRVVTTHRDLVRAPASQAGGTVYLDTDRDDPGPEYALVGGYFEGTDYALLEVDGWNTNKGDVDRVECDYVSRIDYRADTVRSRFAQDCFDRDDSSDGSVRVEVKVSGVKKNGGTAVDWLGTPRTFSKPVTRG